MPAGGETGLKSHVGSRGVTGVRLEAAEGTLGMKEQGLRGRKGLKEERIQVGCWAGLSKWVKAEHKVLGIGIS